MKKTKSVSVIISLWFAGIALSACSDKINIFGITKGESTEISTFENESAILEQKCCQEIDDLRESIIKDKACFNEEIQKAKADDRQFIAVDYLIDKCGENQKNIDFLDKWN